jgi:phosphatidylserine/phosphatidylglycerophosphate/cardiolipin synthase-like enzyme
LQQTIERPRIGKDFAGAQPILRPGRNCWRVAAARKAAMLVDAANYFARLDQALRQAERSILIVGWDFDGRIKLCPDDAECPSLGYLLRSLVEARPELHIHILVWSVAVIHAPGAPLPLLIGAPWQNHERIHVRLDNHHPIYAAHHQKLVAIDDTLAFAGGIDLTVNRWDTCGHEADDPLRMDPEGAAYDPVHDVQMVVSGEAARIVADLARERWKTATGETLAVTSVAKELWPGDLEPDFVDIPVAVARTAPGWADAPPVAEVGALTIDLIKSARRSLYIEAQYFCAHTVGEVLEKSLSAAEGPEIVIVASGSSHGAMERWIMSSNRERLTRRLQRADQYGRLRVFHPVVPTADGEGDVLIHAKVVVADDRVVRIGSSNLNNRSMGLDTECDLAIEGSDPATRGAVARMRDRLLAEHLDVDPARVAETIEAKGSLIRAIDELNRNPRGLRDFEIDGAGPTKPVVGTWLLDPPRPFEPFWLRRRMRPRQPAP